MRGFPRRLVVAAFVAVVAPGLVACGANEEAPSDASVEDFCTTFNLLSEADSGDDFRAFGQRLSQVGTPSDITNDGRAGFEVVARVARSLPADASLEELEDPNVSSQEAAQAKEFLDYGTTTCGDLDSGVGGF